MARKQKTMRLGAGEMEILQMLWMEGPVTILGAQRALGRPVGYTTVQTRLNRLVEKGAVRRTKDRPARYQAAITAAQVSPSHLDFLLERLGGGSIVPLVAHLMKGRTLSREEVVALKELIAESERSDGPPSLDPDVAGGELP